ncbi:TonB family protein [Candidatus Poribacteria bacterium]|nr:TonB family protein [Candidatus Poribacteria bacterium]MYG05706.1 TonB family protein [Candidatus Poribacteria bacterium]MYK23630.1 TonB family protein [Candidatus Poribacteria bacterium]
MNSKLKAFCTIICLLMLFWSHHIAYAQQPISQQAFAIFEQHCLDCHGEFGSYSDVLTIKHKDLIEDRSVIPSQPDASELYLRLLGDTDTGSQMPLGQEPLDADAIATIRRWIEAGATDWEAIPKPKRSFITTEAMLQTIHTHVTSLTTFDRSFARYFTLTHLYNAGATDDNLRAYRNALSKLVNSLSWGAEVSKPTPIDSEETIFYIDLRHYEWDIKSDKWYKIEQAYPYGVQLESSTYTTLCEETKCELPFVRADWFIATASLPPLYHEILGLPKTDKELETQLEVNVAENLKNAPGVRVWRAGFNESGVSVNNRIVERHKSRYGAYWKSYDFAGNVGTQNIFTHPLNFTHDGGEIIFNLPNGLQAYYLSTATGNRLDEAPINIVSDTGSRDPVVRNGLSCMSCHTEGMKTFKDQMRSVIEQNQNPSYDKAQALRLYVEKSEMDSLVREDIARYRRAIKAAGGVFGGSEPIQQLVKQFEGPLDAVHAAAEVGLETDDFLKKIREESTLQNAGLLVLGVENGTVKRDAWESQFGAVVSVLQSGVDKSERVVPSEAPHLIEDLVVLPKYKTQVEPNYPKEAQQAQKEGTVILQATVDVNGIPQDIVSSTNLGFGLEEAAIEALKKTTFHPATQGGKPIRLENVQIPYEFQLFDLKPSNIANTDMVLIPAGEFQMGSDNGGDEPVHTVYVGAFYMDKYEVTNAQYKAFVDANPEWRKEIVHQKHGGSTYLNSWAGDNYPNGKENHPVTMVSWDAAMAYAKWVGKRLPTEAEWEKAARGGLTGKKYPWGNSIDASKANYGKSLDSDGIIKTTPVGSYPANGYGLYDMVGNVQEWCLDEYDGRVYSKSPPLRVSRGGGWYYEAHEVRIANRNASSPLMTLVDYGFRCVRSGIIFNLVESIKFADGTEVKSITKDDIDALRDRPIRLGENDHLDGVMLTNEKDERIHARTCREYDSAIKRGYDTYTTFDIKMSVWFKHHCGLLNALEGAAVPQQSYISNPKVGITNLDLIPFSLFPNLSGDEIDLGATFEKKVRNGELTVIEKDQNVLTTEGIGMGQLLREVIRADFNNDGIEDILLFEYHYATQGTLGFGGVIVLTRKSVDGKFEVVRPPNPMQSSVHPYWSD